MSIIKNGWSRTIILSLLIFLLFTKQSYAEYYLVLTKPNHCKPCYTHKTKRKAMYRKVCSWQRIYSYQSKSNMRKTWMRPTYRKAHHCSVDLSTADDFPCLHPGMQIN